MPKSARAEQEAENTRRFEANRELTAPLLESAKTLIAAGVILDFDEENATLYVSDSAWAQIDVIQKKTLVRVAQGMFWHYIQSRMGKDFPLDVGRVRVTIKGKTTGDVLAGFGGFIRKLYIKK